MTNNFGDIKQSHLAVLNALARDIWVVLDRYDESLPVASVLGVLEAIKHEVILAAMEAADEEDDLDD